MIYYLMQTTTLADWIGITALIVIFATPLIIIARNIGRSK
jgi:hypothetical protein